MSSPPARLIAVIPTVAGRVMRSYSYSSVRPGISLSVAIKTMDRWAVDEIAVIDISRQEKVSPNVLDEIELANSRTPLLYGGGLRSISDIQRLLGVGADRFLFEFGTFGSKDLLSAAAELIGLQAVVASLPVTKRAGRYVTFPTVSPSMTADLRTLATEIIEGSIASEILVIDRQHEGIPDAFDLCIVDELSHLGDRTVLWFGGVGSQVVPTLVHNPLTAGLGIANALFQKELAADHYRW